MPDEANDDPGELSDVNTDAWRSDTLHLYAPAPGDAEVIDWDDLPF